MKNKVIKIGTCNIRILLKRGTFKGVQSNEYHNSYIVKDGRLLLVHTAMVIVQKYFLTSNTEEDEIERLYERVESLLI